jgi:3'-phosphoadenosine 5'-phosphosulfate sulfotransferase (PAPS reductase)/FAD synthetase
MALMAAKGLILPMPDAAIFADTQDEPKEVYAHLEWLKSVLPFPVYVVTAGKLSQRHLDGFNGARTPFFIKAGGMAKRQCTREFKIRPIRRKVREIVGVGARGHIPPNTVTAWVGISIDEADRQKPSGVRFIINRWPLLEDSTRMSRASCARWLLENYGNYILDSHGG